MKKVLLGMSGGVDSSVAAFILKSSGYEVIGVTMQVWQDEDICQMSENGGCCGLSAVEDAKRVADVIGIRHYVLNFKDIFKKKVIEPFISEYLKGRTPNPCLLCNRHVKWEALLARAPELDCAYLATGHYARIVTCENGLYALKKGKDNRKDQTYALYMLTQEQLGRTLFPLGNMKKDEVRGLAEEINLPVAKKRDSQEICFVPDNDYAGFIERERGAMPFGNFIDSEGHILGLHKGILHYTIGQRKGLGIAFGTPKFVTQIRTDTNEVVLGSHEDLMHCYCECEDIRLMGVYEPGALENKRLLVKVRYNTEGEFATLKAIGENRIAVSFEKNVRAITKGQAAVFYDGEICMGGGVICDTGAKK